MNDYIAKLVDERYYIAKPWVSGNHLPKILRKQYAKSSKILIYDSRTKSNPKLMMEMIAVRQQTPPLVAAMGESMENKEDCTLLEPAHKMIPSFSIMGISRI
jgi:hypothetical protein